MSKINELKKYNANLRNIMELDKKNQSNLLNILKDHLLLIISLVMLIINLSLILLLTSFNLIIWGSPNRIVYAIFFYHVSGAWLSYFSFGISFIFHILYLKSRKTNWIHWGKNSVLVGVFFSGFTLITGSLWFNATSGDYNNIFWQWGDARQTMTLVLFISYLSYLIFGKMIEDKEKKARITAILGIVLFPTVPLSYISAIVFTSLHPLINPNPGEPGNIYWDPLKLFMLFFNLIAMTILFVYIVKELVLLDDKREELEKIKQIRLLRE
ncbi:MAG: cytochrome c biogenesis protein CcsA [Promethearchaeota archaeon]